MPGRASERARPLGLALLALALPGAPGALEVEVRETAPFTLGAPPTLRPGQLPDSHLARAEADIAFAWLADATTRYAHGVLGDVLEAATLVVEPRAGGELRLVLPPGRVFEDLVPRLADLDGDGRDEILLVESDAAEGASLAVFGLEQGRLARRAATPFIGRANRWLNPLGVGDFDGDGHSDIALVLTPHLGGVLQLYRYTPPRLHAFAEMRGVSTHRIGSTELGLGQVVAGAGRDRLLLPDQRHRELLLVEWADGRLRERARARLPAALDSGLQPVAGEANRWRARLRDGSYREISVR